MKLINRTLVIALLFLGTGLGVTFAAGETSTADFLLGENTSLSETDANQALTLLVGPRGADGAPGAAGADGAPGVDGESAQIATVAAGDANCPNGGSRISVGDNQVFACNGNDGAQGANGADGRDGAPGTNGTNGRNGAQGPAGPAGANGTGGGGGTGTGYGAGTLTAGACDDVVDVQLKHSFAGGKFSMNQIVMSGIKDVCTGSTLKVYLSIRTGTLYGDGANVDYFANNEIVCQRLVNNTNWTGATVDAREMVIDGTTICNNSTRNTTFALNLISSRDLNTNVGFELG